MLRNRSFSTLGATVFAITVAVLVTVPAACAQSTYKTLYKFDGAKQGNGPVAGVIFDRTGALYGTTLRGGASDAGTVFKLTPNAQGGWNETVLYNFTGGVDGGRPAAGLVFDQNGNLYGTTSSGGILEGVVFELTPNANGSWTERVLHIFCLVEECRDGESPAAGLVFDTAGNLYGTTEYGGDNGGGVVFKLRPGTTRSWHESVLYNFCSVTNCRDGWNPESGLVFDQTGSLYGTTSQGGTGGGGTGTVFRLTPSATGSWKEEVLHDFSGGRNGGFPLAGVIFDAAGNLYGTTEFDGNFGTVFELTPSPEGVWKQKVLYRFTGGTDGNSPEAGVIFDSSGNLYGTTAYGGGLSHCGGQGCDVVFKLAPTPSGGWKETVLHRFFDHPGAFSYAGVIFDASGNLYGTTSGDGVATFGSVFEVTP